LPIVRLVALAKELSPVVGEVRSEETTELEEGLAAVDIGKR
jgi:hypothetical protein